MKEFVIVVFKLLRSHRLITNMDRFLGCKYGVNKLFVG